MESHIKNLLIKEGMITEIRVNKILTENGWSTRCQATYPDETTNKIRSIDIVASLYTEKFDNELSNYSVMCIECKKSNDFIWVFQTDDQINARLSVLTHSITSYLIRLLNKSPFRFVSNIHSIWESKVAFSQQTIKINKRNNKDKYQILKNEEGNFFEAMMQLLKYIYYHYKSDDKTYFPTLLYPVIVYDGSMYECYIENDVIIKEINHISYLSSGIPEDPNQVMIDIININELEKYVTTIKEEHFEKLKEKT